MLRYNNIYTKMRNSSDNNKITIDISQGKFDREINNNTGITFNIYKCKDFKTNPQYKKLSNELNHRIKHDKETGHTLPKNSLDTYYVFTLERYNSGESEIISYIFSICDTEKQSIEISYSYTPIEFRKKKLSTLLHSLIIENKNILEKNHGILNNMVTVPLTVATENQYKKMFFEQILDYKYPDMKLYKRQI